MRSHIKCIWMLIAPHLHLIIIMQLLYFILSTLQRWSILELTPPPPPLRCFTRCLLTISLLALHHCLVSYHTLHRYHASALRSFPSHHLVLSYFLHTPEYVTYYACKATPKTQLSLFRPYSGFHCCVFPCARYVCLRRNGCVQTICCRQWCSSSRENIIISSLRVCEFLPYLEAA